MTNPDKNSLSAETSQHHPAAEITDLLAHREGKGLSVADVFTKTRISTKNLVALEQGDFAALPPPVYTRAYIQQYADLIEIDSRPLLLKYDAFLKSQEDPRPIRKSEDPLHPSQGLKLAKSLGGVLIVLMVVIALSFFLFGPNGNKPDLSAEKSVAPTSEMPTLPAETTTPATEPAPSVTASETAIPVPTTPSPATPAAITPSVSTSPLPSPAPTVKATTIETPGSQKLTIRARETTWVGIRIDEKERQQVLLPPGEVVTYTGIQFKMDIGNAGGIDVSLQGKPVPPLGERGQVVHVTLP